MGILNNYTGIAINSNGVFLVGDYFGGGHLAIVHKRSTADGGILWTNYDDVLFGSSGGDDIAPIRLCLDRTQLYICGNLGTNNAGWIVQARDIANGNVLWNDSSAPGDVYCFPVDVVQSSSGLFVSGFVQHSGSPNHLGWRIEKRDKTTGVVIWSQEYTWINTHPSGHFPYSMDADENNVYIIGGEPVNPSGTDSNIQWRIECRDSATGGLTWSRNINSGGGIFGCGIAVYGDALFVIGQRNVAGGGLVVKKIKVSDGTDYGGSWSDNNLAPVLANKCLDPAYIAVSANGVYVLCTEYFNGGGRLYHREKIDLNTGARVWAYPDANNSDAFSYPKKITALGSYIYLCGSVLGAGSAEAAYVEKCKA